jgi:hypothetical protein
VILSGFMRTGNQWKVLLSVKVRNPDPRAAPLNSFLSMAEGEKEGVTSGENKFVVELVKLYPVQEKADIINSGTPVTLSMKDNGFEGQVPSSGASLRPTPTPGESGVSAATPRFAKPPPGGFKGGMREERENPVSGGSPPVGSAPSNTSGTLNDQDPSGNFNAIKIGGIGGTPK